MIRMLDEIFNAMLMLIVVIPVMFLSMEAHAQQSTFRDSQGRTVGTASTDSQGNVTFRDSGGRTTGTASTDNGGQTTFRDAGGRTTGTVSGGRRR
jgi:hypothetical protein